MPANTTYECTLTPESLEVAKRELNEDPETRLQKVQELRELFKTRADIKFRSDDEFLLRFLRNKKFNIDKAFKMMVHHYKVRRDYPKLFNNFKPSAVKYYLDEHTQMVCPGKDKLGRTVVLGRVGKMNPDTFDFHDALKSMLMMMEILLLDENIQVNGVVHVVDHSGMTRKHLRFGTPMTMKMMVDVFESATPIRSKAAHYIRQPDIFEIMFSVMRPLLSEKMKKRLHFHGDEFGTLHEHVPSAILPSEFGGQLEKFDNSEYIKKILAAEDYFIENSQYGFLNVSQLSPNTNTNLNTTWLK
ncbi:alpha-tocopherol transfer protein-like [Saccoglossus kowalevskii]